MAIICTTITYDGKGLILFQIYLTFIQVVRVPAYISTIISAAADEGPDEMMCFPAGLHYFKNVQNITEIDVLFFPRKEAFISPYMRTFPKGRMIG